MNYADNLKKKVIDNKKEKSQVMQVQLDPRLTGDFKIVYQGTAKLVKTMLNKAQEDKEITHQERCRCIDAATKFIKCNQSDPDFIRLLIESMSDDNKKLLFMSLPGGKDPENLEKIKEKKDLTDEEVFV